MPESYLSYHQCHHTHTHTHTRIHTVKKKNAYHKFYPLEKLHSYCIWVKKISLFNNSEKLVQILLEFSHQIVEGYKFVLAKFRWKRPFQSTKSQLNQNKNLNQDKGWTYWPYFTLCTKCDRSMCKNLDLLLLTVGAWRAWANYTNLIVTFNYLPTKFEENLYKFLWIIKEENHLSFFIHIVY